MTDEINKISVNVGEGFLKINGQEILEIEEQSFLYDNNYYLVVQVLTEDVFYWVEDYSGRRSTGVVGYGGFTNDVQMMIGSDENRQNQLNGTIHNLYLSSDGYSTKLNQWMREILIRYRDLQYK